MESTFDSVKERIKEYKIIAIVRGVPTEAILPLARSLCAGGIRLVEFPFDQNSADGYRDTLDAIRLTSVNMQGKMTVGAGTVLTPEQVGLAADAGAQFIVSPNENREVIAATKARGLVSVPGALTPTEIAEAHDAGADFVKIFPASVFGPEYIKAVGTPLSHIPLIAMGGIKPDNIADYARAGACAFGVAGGIIRPEWIAAGAYDRIAAEAQRYTDALHTL